MKRILIACGLVACSADKPHSPVGTASGETSHPAMPNQIEVGSTLDGRYRIVKKLGDVGEYAVLAVEHAQVEQARVLMTPGPSASSRAGEALNDAAKRQATRGVSGEIAVDDVGTTPQGSVYVVLTASDEQVAQLLAGAIKLGG